MLSDEDAKGSAEDKGLDRILSLSDGVFAFAITLLVLGLAVPSLSHNEARTSVNLIEALSGEVTAFYSYGISFFVIGIWWFAHHRLFRYIKRYDSTLMWRNLFFLLFITIIPFQTQLLAQYGDIQIAVVIYDASQVLGGIALSAVWRHATKKHLVVEGSLTANQIRNIRFRGYVPIVTFLVAIAIVFVLPNGDASFANFSLFAMFPLTWIFSRGNEPKD